METLPELMEYLDGRGARYGIPGSDIFDMIPDSISQSPKQSYEFMQLKDISHIKPLNEGGNPNLDNWTLEDSSTNRARGARTMTQAEIDAAEADAQADADAISGKQLVKVAAMGTALGGGGIAAEAVLSSAGTIAEAVVNGATILSVLPAVITIGAVGGVGYLGYRYLKKNLKVTR